MQDFKKKTNEQLITLVKKGQETFFEMAKAILEIDERDIWKSYAKTMAEFCEVEFGMSGTDVSRYKNAARVLMNLEGFPILPLNEGQARELAKQPNAGPQQQVWKAVLERVGTSKEAITARLIAETAETVLGTSKSKQKKSESELVVSGVGKLVQIAQQLQDVEIAVDDHDAALMQLELIQSHLERLRESLTN